MTTFEVLYLLAMVVTLVISVTALVRTRHFNRVAAELAAKQLEMITRAERSGAWLTQEGRFRAINKNVEGIWMRKVGSTATEWQVHPTQKATLRDVKAFEAEAIMADELLQRTLDLDPKELQARFGHTPVERWLNAASALGVDLQSRLQISTRNEGVEHKGAEAQGLPEMSAIACTLLAGGARPSDPRNASPRSESSPSAVASVLGTV